MKKRISPISIILFTVLLIYSVYLLYMVAWGFMTSLKSTEEYMYGEALAFFPEKWQWNNYAVVYRNFIIIQSGMEFDLWAMLMNSVIYSVGGALLSALIPFIVSYITAKYDFWYCRIINAAVIILLAGPIVGGAASTISILDALGLYNTFPGMLILKAGFLNIYYLMYYASWKAIPDEYRDAAGIDGASEWVIMVRIMIPMSYKMFLTVFLILFVADWNDYQTPLMYLSNFPVLAYGVQTMSLSNKKIVLDNGLEDTINRAPYRMAASMILLLPIMIIFIVLNDKLMGNLSMGGLKE